MIAPIRVPDPWTTEKERVLRKARRIVASMLLGPSQSEQAKPTPIPAWKAWLFAAWVMGIVVVYLWFMVVK